MFLFVFLPVKIINTLYHSLLVDIFLLELNSSLLNVVIFVSKLC